MRGMIIARINDKITRITGVTPVFGGKIEKHLLSHHLLYLYFTLSIQKRQHNYFAYFATHNTQQNYGDKKLTTVVSGKK